MGLPLTSLELNSVARLKRGYAADIWPEAANVRARDTHSGDEAQGAAESCASGVREGWWGKHGGRSRRRRRMVDV